MATKQQALFVVTHLCLVLLLCMLSSQTEATVARIRRHECQDGTYAHEGRSCCKCRAGYKVKTHCTDHAQTDCEECAKENEYQSHASEQTTCDRCTSCAHPNANLEVDEPCTPLRDTTCKCKKDHYCPSGKTPCNVCEPCHECGPEGIKVACSASNNTICNDKPEDNSLAVTLGVIIPLLAVIAVAAAIWFFRNKKQSGNQTIENGQIEHESLPLNNVPEPVVSLGPHIPAIAEVIGWKITRNLAMSSKIPDGIIESCESKNDSMENTIALLRAWEEKEGKDASSKLIQYLKENNLNSKLEKVSEKLSCGSS